MLGNATLEMTDGKLVDMNFIKNQAYFPYNYEVNKWDVISVRHAQFNGSDLVTTMIKHSKTTLYPIVSVVEYDKSARTIRVTDGKYSAVLNINKADIFGKLEKGSFIQFRTETNNNVDKKGLSNNVEIVSVLPVKDVKGSLVERVYGIFNGQRTGKLIAVKDNGENQMSTIEVLLDNDIYNENAKYGYAVFNVNKADVKELKAYINENIAFKVSFDGRYVLATDFRNMKDEPITKPVVPEVEAPAIEKLEAKAKMGEAVIADKTAVDDQIKASHSKSEQAALTERMNKALDENAKKAVEKFLVDAKNSDLTDNAYNDSKAKAEAAIVLKGGDATLTGKVTDADAVRTAKGKLVDVKDLSVGNDYTPANVKAKAKDKAKEQAGDVTVEVKLSPASDGLTANYNKGEKVNVEVTLTKGTAKDMKTVVYTLAD